MLAEHFVNVAAWDSWANAAVLATLQASGGEPGTALAAYQHVLETELVWLRRMENDPQPMIKLWGGTSLDICTQWTVEAAARLDALARSLDHDAATERTFTYRNSSGAEFTDDLAETLFHMFFHSAQYRGEAAGFLNAAGHRVPDLDFILWLRNQRAAGRG